MKSIKRRLAAAVVRTFAQRIRGGIYCRHCERLIEPNHPHAEDCIVLEAMRIVSKPEKEKEPA